MKINILKATSGVLVVFFIILLAYLDYNNSTSSKDIKRAPDVSKAIENEDAENGLSEENLLEQEPAKEVKEHTGSSYEIFQEQHAEEEIRDPVEYMRQIIMYGKYGEMPIGELLSLAITTHDPSRNEMRLALLLRKEEALPVLKERLIAAPDGETRHLLGIIQRQLRWPETLPEILIILNDTARTERTRALAATAAAIFREKNAIPQVRNLLQTVDEPQSRLHLAMAVGIFHDDESIEIVEGLLNDNSPHIRAAAAEVLGRLGNSSGEGIALELSRHDNFGIRGMAVKALSYIGTPEAMERLKEMRESDPSPNVRNESAENIARAELEALDRDEAITELKRLLTPDSRYHPRWAFVYLAKHFALEEVDFLKTLSTTPGPLQYPATVALLETGSDAVMLPNIWEGEQ